jgi:hypothetical protein
MVKWLSICAALVALGICPVYAQKREAFLQTIEVPAAGFDFVLATPKPGAGMLPNLGSSPEALVVHLPGDELAVVFEDADKMLQAVDVLKRPVCAFRAGGPNGGSPQPVTLYVVPKGGSLAMDTGAGGRQ